MQRTVLLTAGGLGGLLVLVAGFRFGAPQAVLALVGLGLGFALFHSRFGFSAAWHQLIQVGNGTGARAQVVLLVTATTVVSVVAAAGWRLGGGEPSTAPHSLGWALLLGAFLFGVGMQLGGSCASGTLFAVGTAQSTVVFSLAGFVAGALLWTRVAGTTEGWDSIPGIRLADHVGWAGSWALTMTVLGALAVASVVLQRRRVPPPVRRYPSASGARRVWRGTWPLWTGAAVLGALAGAVLWASGRVWGTTEGFALWGAEIAQLLGFHPQGWEYWQRPENAQALAGSVLQNPQSLTNITIAVGACLATAAAGAWRLHRHTSWHFAVGGLAGGMLMGFGARMSGGCNIGALIGGISSGSVSGWVWLVFALLGTSVGIRLRPLFGLGMIKNDDSIC